MPCRELTCELTEISAFAAGQWLLPLSDSHVTLKMHFKLWCMSKHLQGCNLDASYTSSFGMGSTLHVLCRRQGRQRLQQIRNAGKAFPGQKRSIGFSSWAWPNLARATGVQYPATLLSRAPRPRSALKFLPGSSFVAGGMSADLLCSYESVVLAALRICVRATLAKNCNACRLRAMRKSTSYVSTA